MKILVFVPKQSPRISYIFDFVFIYRLRMEYQLLTIASVYSRSEGPKFSYDFQMPSDGSCFIHAHSLLFEPGQIQAQPPECVEAGEVTGLFPNHSENSLFRFDPFASIFYVISRYEEYLEFKGDHMGRFRAADSLAYRHNFLHVPVVDKWILMLAKALYREWKLPDYSLPNRINIQPTIDIDSAFAYRGRSGSYILPRILKNLLLLRIRKAFFIWQVWSKLREDPFDTYEQITEATSIEKVSKPIFFVLTGSGSRYDDGMHANNKEFRDILADLSKFGDIGIHPSVGSRNHPDSLALEIATLAKLTGKPINQSRQHFLLLEFPGTYRKLIELGIRADWTMGFADEIGFRAGTAHPFCWYDLQLERVTELWVHSFQVMDVSLKKYLGLNPDAAIRRIEQIKSEMKDTGGNLCFIWHNSSFTHLDGWRDWDRVFEYLLE